MIGHVKMDDLFIYIVNGKIVLITATYSPFIYQTSINTWNLRDSWFKDSYDITDELPSSIVIKTVQKFWNKEDILYSINKDK